MREFAEKAASSMKAARLLLEAGLPDDAVNRAYYAMFDAVQHFLSARGEINPPRIKSHNGVAIAFSRAALQSGGGMQELARAFSRTLAARIEADYGERAISQANAEMLVSDAERFVVALIAEEDGNDV